MKVGVIGGAGTTGSTCVFNLARERVIDDVVIVDLDERRAKGQAIDVGQSVLPETETNVSVGGYDDLEDADAVIVTASAPFPDDLRDRSEMLSRNRSLAEDVFAELDGVVECPLVVATSPTDLLVTLANRTLGLPREYLLGYNLNDTLRFRWAIAEHLDVAPHEVEAYVLGEHGDTQVPIFSETTVRGRSRSFTAAQRETITERTVNLAWETFEMTGEVPRWATGFGLALVGRAICSDEDRLLPCSVDAGGAYGYDDVSLALPTRIGAEGLGGIVEFTLSADERAKLDESAAKIRDDFERLEG